jgi:hypothetical protein
VAQKVLVQLVDDLDGSTPSDIETVSFALDGVNYEIDLGPQNASQLRDTLGQFVGSARRVGGRIKRGAASRTVVPNGTGASNSREQTKAIRDWARSTGYELSDRGRIPADIVEAFEQAHAKSPNSGPARRSGAHRGSRKSSSADAASGTANGSSSKAATPSFSD